MIVPRYGWSKREIQVGPADRYFGCNISHADPREPDAFNRVADLADGEWSESISIAGVSNSIKLDET